MFYHAPPKERERGDDPQWTTIMSHEVACYSKRGWVGKQLSSRRAPVLTFSVDLDTENTRQCHSLYFKSTGCLTKPLHFPFSHPHDTQNHFPHTFGTMTQHVQMWDRQVVVPLKEWRKSTRRDKRKKEINKRKSASEWNLETTEGRWATVRVGWLFPQDCRPPIPRLKSHSPQ